MALPIEPPIEERMLMSNARDDNPVLDAIRSDNPEELKNLLRLADAIRKDDKTQIKNRLRSISAENQFYFSYTHKKKPLCMEYHYALRWACIYGSLLCLKFLVVEPDFKLTGHYYNYHDTPLHFACLSNKNTRGAQFLLKLASDQQIESPWEIVSWAGFTPFHYACLFGSTETVSLLLDLGADPFKKNKLKQGPCDLALEFGHPRALGKVSIICKHMMKRASTTQEWDQIKLYMPLLAVAPSE